MVYIGFVAQQQESSAPPCSLWVRASLRRHDRLIDR